MPQAQGGVAATAADGKLYVFGGEQWVPEHEVFEESWVYDPKTDRWEALPPHMDWLPSEALGLKMPSNLSDQFAWNIYLQPAHFGGETVIYQTKNVAPIEELQAYASAKYRPVLGDLLLFCSRSIHSVFPGTGKRITLSGFFGSTASGEILFWV
jgi:hypothetical protein